MIVLEGKSQRIIKEMKQQGRVVTLSRETTAAIDHQLAMALAPIKEEFNKKERASRAYVTEMESRATQI